MTFETLNKVIKDNEIPMNVRLMSDSGWECGSTDMNGIYYNKKANILVFTQDTEFNEYVEADNWVQLNV